MKRFKAQRQTARGFTPTPVRPGRMVCGFTLIELLIVVGIVAVLGTVVTLALNPAELLRQARDSNRITDLKTIERAIALFQVEQSGASLGDPTKIYLSLPDASPTCGSYALPSVSSPYTGYICRTAADARKADGNGWIPINFSSVPGGTPFSALPVDPVNVFSSGLYYSYVSGVGFVVTGALESQKYRTQVAFSDTGTDPARFEVGTAISLWGRAKGLVGYWNFDEGAGTTATEFSGQSGNGTITGASWVTGKIGNALNFTVSGNVVNVADSAGSALDVTSAVTVMLWARRSGAGAEYYLLSKFNGSSPTTNPFEMRLSGTTPQFRVSSLTHTLCDEETNYFLSSGPSITNNTWYHLAGTYSQASGLVTTYTNGVAGSPTAASFAMPVNNANLRIGKTHTGVTCWFSGSLDDVRVYNRALSQQEIQEIYDVTK